MKTNCLIVYFSHIGEAYVGGDIKMLNVGNTHAAAVMMQSLLQCDMERIEPKIPYPINYKQMIDVAKQELQTDARPQIKGHLSDIKNYDTIILGYPNWWGTMPMIVETYLESNDFTNKTILPFCTNEGSGMGSSEKDLCRLCESSEIKAGLPIIGGQVYQAMPQIKAWLKRNNLL
ncbi:flavodoxin [Dielma fastidiosa]|uniref:NAD(P)H-dependent oxidoreductase n=1 Tax=Dielma fastidiosa TaxID=1034346 RepID=A0AB35UR30_9FIRM|nr:flavodoxin [Dielma fastidiosa]MDY5167560.1 NAD(P)H-dependent oxidoreductase [Dielma fastidiosa]